MVVIVFETEQACTTTNASIGCRTVPGPVDPPETKSKNHSSE